MKGENTFWVLKKYKFSTTKNKQQQQQQQQKTQKLLRLIWMSILFSKILRGIQICFHLIDLITLLCCY